MRWCGIAGVVGLVRCGGAGVVCGPSVVGQVWCVDQV